MRDIERTMKQTVPVRETPQFAIVQPAMRTNPKRTQPRPAWRAATHPAARPASVPPRAAGPASRLHITARGGGSWSPASPAVARAASGPDAPEPRSGFRPGLSTRHASRLAVDGPLACRQSPDDISGSAPRRHRLRQGRHRMARATGPRRTRKIAPAAGVRRVAVVANRAPKHGIPGLERRRVPDVRVTVPATSERDLPCTRASVRRCGGSITRIRSVCTLDRQHRGQVAHDRAPVVALSRRRVDRAARVPK